MSQIDEPIFTTESVPTQPISGTESDVAAQIRALVQEQRFCVLCTQGQSQPYGSLIAYAFTDDLKTFFFTTPRATRKFKLLSECDRVALVIDSRCQHPEDMTRVAAVTITGTATWIESGPVLDQGLRFLKQRHSYLQHFVEAASVALFRIEVVRYFYVTRFQEVSQWQP